MTTGAVMVDIRADDVIAKMEERHHIGFLLYSIMIKLATFTVSLRSGKSPQVLEREEGSTLSL